MGLPNTASRTLYRVREAEVPILSAAITVMKKISFRSILLRPSYCARPIRSPDFKPLCYRWDRPILWATLTVETKRKPSRILIRNFGGSHQKPCSGSFVEGARRRLLVQYTGRQAGDGLFRGDTPYLALKFNGSGVIAPIYASSLLKLLITFAGFSAAESGCRPDWLCIIVSLLGREQPLYFLLDVALIMFFTSFCTPIVVNPQQMADDLRRHGGFVPGIRPGAETAAYIDHVQTRITVIGAMYLAAAWVLPALLFPGMRFDFSGSALLIVVIGTLELLACTRTLLRLPPST